MGWIMDYSYSDRLFQKILQAVVNSYKTTEILISACERERERERERETAARA